MEFLFPESCAAVSSDGGRYCVVLHTRLSPGRRWQQSLIGQKQPVSAHQQGKKRREHDTLCYDLCHVMGPGPNPNLPLTLAYPECQFALIGGLL